MRATCSSRNKTLEEFATLAVARIIPCIMKDAVEQSCVKMGKKLICPHPCLSILTSVPREKSPVLPTRKPKESNDSLCGFLL